VIEDHSSKFSPSKLSTYKECPRKYKFRYIDGLKRQGQTAEQFLGTCVHKAFETLYEGLQKGKTLAEAEAVALFESEFALGFAGLLPGPDDKPPVKQDWLEVGRACIANYYRQYAPFGQDRTVAVERRIGFAFEAEGQKYRLEGFIDRLALSNSDDAFEIHDYKTAKSLPNQQHVDEDWQLALYEIAVRSEWPDTKKVRLIWHYVRHGKTLVSSRDIGQLEELRADVARTVTAIKHDRDFRPVESRLCGWCEYKALCPLFAHGETLLKLPADLRSADEGRQAVDALEELDQRKKALRSEIRSLEAEEARLEEQLISYARAHAFKSVSGTHCDAVVAEKESYKFPTKTGDPKAFAALEAELSAHPVWPAISHFDAHKLLDGLKAKDWPEGWKRTAEDALRRFAERVVETALRLRRRRDADD
jgi:putative RecB family exonuclease